MRLVTYSHAGAAPAAGIVLDGCVVSRAGIGYSDVISFLRDGDKAIAAAKGLFSDPSAPKLEDVKLHAPVPKPDKFICIGLNYRDHAIESGMAIPDLPTVFTKYPNAICGHGDEIVLPSVSKQVDYEAEFAFVIGKTCKNVPKEDWKDVIFGYTIVHDVSARDYQLATSQWTIARPLTRSDRWGRRWSQDEIDDPHNLRISLDLNGQTLQDSNTSQFVFDIRTVNYLSTVMTLEPGDIVSTGTPPGVGFARRPPVFLKPGDDVAVKIEGLGELRNSCVSD